MNEARLLNAIGFPKVTQVMKTLPYNQMENKLTVAQKKIISELVVSRGIRILATIQTNNTNIEAFETETERYDSIVFFSVHVKELKKIAQIYKVFMSVIPKPLVMLFYDSRQTKWLFSTHEKKKDGFLLIKVLYEINAIVTLDLVEKRLRFERFDKTTLKSFYESWIEQLLQIELKERYDVSKSISLKNNILEVLVAMDKQIDDYVKQAKKETQLNKRITLQQQANKIKLEKQVLIKKEQLND